VEVVETLLLSHQDLKEETEEVSLEEEAAVEVEGTQEEFGTSLEEPTAEMTEMEETEVAAEVVVVDGGETVTLDAGQAAEVVDVMLELHFLLTTDGRKKDLETVITGVVEDMVDVVEEEEVAMTEEEVVVE